MAISRPSNSSAARQVALRPGNRKSAVVRIAGAAAMIVIAVQILPGRAPRADRTPARAVQAMPPTELAGWTTGLDLFMMTGNEIVGDSPSAAHPGAIGLVSTSAHLDVPASALTGTAPGRPAFKPLTITKLLDTATAALEVRLASGQPIRRVEIYFDTPPSAVAPKTVAKYVLTNVVVLSQDFATTAGGATETLTLDFAGGMSFEYFPAKPPPLSTPTKFCYDRPTGSAACPV